MIRWSPPESAYAQLPLLVGPHNKHLQLLTEWSGVLCTLKGHHLELQGETLAVDHLMRCLDRLIEEAAEHPLSTNQLYLTFLATRTPEMNQPFILSLPKKTIQPKTPHQQIYLNRLMHHRINFGIGPAGTGKTFLGVAYAVHALHCHQVEKIVLVRPVLEAGEHLGFLPGDITEKVDPYLRPLYDALNELMGAERMKRAMEQGLIELAPLAFMRGRTFQQACIILDEAQNTTPAQMKLFLTRLGLGSRMIITGDLQQSDLPARQRSGLQEALHLLAEIDEIRMTYFEASDIVRDPLVQKIVSAYEQQPVVA